MPNYGSKAYWDKRYATSNVVGSSSSSDSGKNQGDEIECFDWYQGWEALSKHILPLFRVGHLSSGTEVLFTGCGSSTMPAELYATGMKNITCVDFSQVLIHRMRDRWAHLHDLEFVVGDACSLPGCMTMQNGQHVGMASEDWTNCFGIVFDKAMLDAILCAGGTRDPLLRAQTAVREAWRVLKRGGFYILCSHGKPDSRLAILKQQQEEGVEGTGIWRSIQVKLLPKPVTALHDFGASPHHYLYLCQK